MNRDQNQIEDVLAKLDVLAPQDQAEKARPGVMLARIKAQSAPDSRWTGLWQLFQRPVSRSRRFAMVAAIVLALTVAFSFPGVRTAAAEFLGSFRVQRFAPISISPEQITLLQEMAAEGLTPGEFEQVTEATPMEAAKDAAEASALAGFTVRLPGTLADPASYQVGHPGDVRFIIDVAGARAMMEAAGVDPMLLPETVDGQAVDVTAFDGVTTVWDEGFILHQSPSPEVTYPPDVDLNVLGQAALQFLGMSEFEAAAAAATIDWTSTFVLPIPSEFATYEEVSVDGASGLIIKSLDGTISGIVWQKDGIVYVLSGEVKDAAVLLEVADSLE